MNNDITRAYGVLDKNKSGKKQTYEYGGNGILILRDDLEFVQGKIVEFKDRKYAVSDKYQDKIFKHRLFRIKADQSIIGQAKQVYFIPSKTRFAGDYWAKQVQTHAPTPTIFHPREIEGGKLIAKTRTHNYEAEPGPKGGMSFHRRYNKFERFIYAMWDESTIEEFYQSWNDNPSPMDDIFPDKSRQLRRGEGTNQVAIKELMSGLERKIAVPFNYTLM